MFGDLVDGFLVAVVGTGVHLPLAVLAVDAERAVGIKHDDVPLEEAELPGRPLGIRHHLL